MLQKRTVFILGAGTSMPYGFPSGAQLTDDIRDGLKPMGELESRVLNSGITDVQIRKLEYALQRNPFPSIDALLEAQEDLRPAGKTSIIHQISHYERSGKSMEPSPNLKDWYPEFFNLLAQGLTRSDIENCSIERNVSIFTFNYDRSLEKYLWCSLIAGFAINKDEAWKFLKETFPIYHIHGSLGEIYGKSSSVVKYPANIDYEQAREISESISIAHDPVDNLEARLEHDFERADQVCVLGFTYHPNNVIKLPFRHLRGGIPFYSTAYNFRRGQQIRANSFVGREIEFLPEKAGAFEALHLIPIE